jgi:hypothetical protein
VKRSNTPLEKISGRTNFYSISNVPGVKGSRREHMYFRVGKVFQQMYVSITWSQKAGERRVGETDVPVFAFAWAVYDLAGYVDRYTESPNIGGSGMRTAFTVAERNAGSESVPPLT